MSSTQLEFIRAAHEEIERCERAAVNFLSVRTKTHKDSINQEHKVNEQILRINELAEQLDRYYKNEDGARQKEIDNLAGNNVLSIFYERLKEIKDYHRRFPNLTIEKLEPPSLEDETEEEVPYAEFTGEEGYGKYIDIHIIYEKYVNMRQFKDNRVDYLHFLDKFHIFYDIPKALKDKEFKTYLEGLLNYLISFFERIHPLSDLQKELDKVAEEFEKEWASNNLPGWQKAPFVQKSTANPEQNGTPTTENEPKIDTNGTAEKKPDQIQDPNLYCEPCEKFFAKETVFKAHLSGKKHLQAIEHQKKMKVKKHFIKK